tara:strand:+ start:497 stop:694 length:198 start_codon:yes stop_codon:yes gene_type:complete
MKQCKKCGEMYDIPHPTKGIGEFSFFGDYCPYCETFNSDINKYSIISLIIFIIIGSILYLSNLLN